MNLENYFDHTVLKAVATNSDIAKLCEEAAEYNFKSVCVNPCHVAYAKELLKESSVLVCTVIGFPLGANTTSAKVFETKDAINNGADEIDMVINIGALKSKDYDLVLNDIKEVRKASLGKTLKVIIETAYLTEEEKIKCCQLVTEAGADFIKTSTGFAGSGATTHDIKLMKENIGTSVKIKASGGVKTLENMVAMIEAGASRIGASSSVIIMNEKTIS